MSVMMVLTWSMLRIDPLTPKMVRCPMFASTEQHMCIHHAKWALNCCPASLRGIAAGFRRQALKPSSCDTHMLHDPKLDTGIRDAERAARFWSFSKSRKTKLKKISHMSICSTAGDPRALTAASGTGYYQPSPPSSLPSGLDTIYAIMAA